MSIQLPKGMEIVPLERLTPYEKNARIHSEDQISQIMRSIQEFGFNAPILIDGSNGIIAGHGRLTAAKRLGMTEVPVVQLEHLSPSQKRAYILADNQIAANATWDAELLASEVGDLGDMDLDVLGFSDEELSEILGHEIDGEPESGTAAPSAAGSEPKEDPEPRSAGAPPDPEPDSDPEVPEDDHPEDRPAHQCPKCGHEFD